MVTLNFATFIICVCFIAKTRADNNYKFPSSDYEYAQQRENIEDGVQAKAANPFELNEDEQVVSHYMQYMKWTQFKQTVNNSGFYTIRPIMEVLPEIVASDLYNVIRQLPKGGNLHSHENHQLGKRKLYEIVWKSADFENLWILPANHPTMAWTLDFFINPPVTQPPWEKVKGNKKYSFEKILKHQTFMSIIGGNALKYPTDSTERWRQMNPLWSRGSSQLIMNKAIREKYLEALLEEQIQDGVQVYESRYSFGSSIYVLNKTATATNGKQLVDVDSSLDMNITMSVVERLKKKYPHFLGFKRIASSQRNSLTTKISADLTKYLSLQKRFPDHVIGYDLVSEEDQGNSLLYFSGPHLSLYNSNTASSLMQFYLHATETNWAEDLITSLNDQDPVGTLENLYDVIVLGAKRIGHGVGAIKHPYLLEKLRDMDIAIEVCPISNHLLGYVPDLRNHPAIHYIRSGIKVVLSADDPGTFGYDHLSVDWFQAYVAWSLNLADLKQISQNSLIYSGLTPAELQYGLTKWQEQWQLFVGKIKTQACSSDLTANAPIFGKVFPQTVPLDRQTNVTVYGRNFERAICKGVVCKFGNQPAAKSIYVTNFKIVCVSPLPNTVSAPSTVALTVSLDGGNTFTSVGNFAYKAIAP